MDIKDNVLSDEAFQSIMNSEGNEILQQIIETPKDSDDNEKISDMLNAIA